jgi:hypothetical protein
VAHIRVWAGLVLLAVVLLAGCRVDARLDVSLKGDGSGVLRSTLTLDADAMAQLGGPQSAAKQIRLSDLQAAGWTVSGWNHDAITFAHDFHGQSELAQRLADLVGPHGVLRDPHITRERGWLDSSDAVSMVVDMRAPATGIGSDADLKARLRAAGVDPAVLDAQLTSQLRSALHLTVVVHLPDGQTRTFQATNGTVTTVTAAHSHRDWDRIVKIGIAAALALLGALFLLAASVSARRNRRRRAQRVRSTRIEHERAPLM